MSCSSLALAIERKKARDGLVAIPRSNKREKMMKRKRSELKGQDFSTDEYSVCSLVVPTLEEAILTSVLKKNFK